MRGVLAEVGFADAALTRGTPDGLQLIDGHLRTEVAGDAEIPVLVLDVNEQEADLILATLDPLAAMAEANSEALADVLDGMQASSEAVRDMLDGLTEQHGIKPPDFNPSPEDEQARLDARSLMKCPAPGHEFKP